MENPVEGQPNYSVEEMFNKYLEIMHIDKRTTHPNDMRKVRNAFFSALNMFLLFQRDTLSIHTEEERMDHLKNLLTETQEMIFKTKGKTMSYKPKS